MPRESASTIAMSDPRLSTVRSEMRADLDFDAD